MIYEILYCIDILSCSRRGFSCSDKESCEEMEELLHDFTAFFHILLFTGVSSHRGSLQVTHFSSNPSMVRSSNWALSPTNSFTLL